MQGILLADGRISKINQNQCVVRYDVILYRPEHQLIVNTEVNSCKEVVADVTHIRSATATVIIWIKITVKQCIANSRVFTH